MASYKRPRTTSSSSSSYEEGSSSEAGSSSETGSTSEGSLSEDQLPSSSTDVEDATDIVRRKLIVGGHMDWLKDRMEKRLAEVGWRLSIMSRCREVVQETGSNTKYEVLFQSVRQDGKDRVPERVREYMLRQIKYFYELPEEKEEERMEE